MNISEIFIRRPVMTTLVMLAIVLFGVIGFGTLPLNALPNVDFPTIEVTATLPGASPENMASSVATPLEKQFSTIAGITAMTSSSSLGTTLLTLQFDLSRNIDGAAQDIQAAITAAGPLLPPTLPAPPTYQKVNPANEPIIYLALRSDTMQLSAVDEYAETIVGQHLSLISGVALVEVFGQQKYAVRAQMNPNLLASFGIGIDQVNTAIAAGNVKEPTGTLNGKFQATTIETNDQLTKAAQFRQLVVTYLNGRAVRLGDLGTVLDGVQNDKIAAWEADTRAILLAIQRQPGANTVQVVNNIKKALPGLEEKLPAGLDVDVLYDLSTSIVASVHDVESTLLLTIGLVVLVIFFFLGNLSATWIASMALPMSIVGTFAAMSLLGFSLDNLSLMALTLSVGFVVDDAIVVLENIVRHMEMGEPVFTAALTGSKEIGFTIISMTTSLVAVFIPVLFLSGIIGRLFNEFAITISVAILVSCVVSLTLTPMLCSRVLKAGSHETGLAGVLTRFFNMWRDAYEMTLDVVLSFRLVTLLLSFVLLGVTAWLFVVVPKGFMPSDDTGQVVIYTEASQAISFDDMVRHQQTMAEIVQKDPNVLTYLSSVGTGGATATINDGVIDLYLKPANQRLTADQVVDELRPKLAQVTGMAVFPQNPPTINIGGQLTKSQYTFSLQSPNTKDLYQWTPIMMDKIVHVPGTVDVTSDLELDSPQVSVKVDRDKASLLGVTAQQVDDALYDAYGTRQVSTIFTPTDEFWVILEVLPQYYRDQAFMQLLDIHSSSGKLIPLNTIAAMTAGTTPLLINHMGQLPAATISFNLKTGASLGTVLDQIGTVAKSTLPPSVTGSFTGTASAFTDAFTGLWGLMLLAVVVIYIVLGVLYESYIHPITILAGLPSAGLGALLTLILFGKQLDIYAFLGLIMLIGIVKKNAIMMIDFAVQEERENHKTAEEAIHYACLVRFRPIMMTTMAALMGSVPIALGLGAGGQARQGLGLVVLGGLMVSQLLTLYITPVIYIYMDEFAGLFRRPSVAGATTSTRPLTA